MKKMSSNTGTLEDAHILELSEKITCDTDLMELGVKVLKLPECKIESAIFDKKEIQPAAHKVLRSWLRKQSDRHEAYNTLQ